MKKSAVILTSLFSSIVHADSLIGHWSFDEHYKDSAQGKHHGKIVGDPVKFIDGKHSHPTG